MSAALRAIALRPGLSDRCREVVRAYLPLLEVLAAQTHPATRADLFAMVTDTLRRRVAEGRADVEAMEAVLACWEREAGA